MPPSGHKHILSQTAIYAIARGVPGLISFLAIPLFTRRLAEAEYGRYALVVITVNLLNALLFQWLRLSLVRYLPANKEDSARLKSTLMTMALLLILAIGGAGTLFCLLPIGHTWRPVLIPCWAMLSVQAIFELCCEYSRAAIRPWHYMILQLTRAAAAIGLGLTFLAMGSGWWGPLAGVTCGMAVAVAYVYRRDWADVRLRIDPEILVKVCQYGIPLSVTVALAVVVASSDRFLIARFMGEASAGLYAASADFTSQTLTLLMMVIYMAMFPIAVRAWERDGKAAAQEQMRSNASLLMAVGVPCVIGIALLSRGIAHCFFGESFRAAAANIMPLIALGSFLAGFKAYHFDAAFQFMHRTIYQVWIVLFVAVVNIGLNLIAIPRWGINGSAMASVLAYAVSIGLTISLGRRHLVLPFPRRACAQVLLAGAVMAALLYPFRAHISALAMAAQVAGGAIAYCSVLILANFLDLRGPLLQTLRFAQVESRVRFSGRNRSASTASRSATIPSAKADPTNAIF